MDYFSTFIQMLHAKKLSAKNSVTPMSGKILKTGFMKKTGVLS